MVAPSRDRNDNRYGERGVEDIAEFCHRVDQDLVDTVLIDVPRCSVRQRWHYQEQERGGPAPAWQEHQRQPRCHGNQVQNRDHLVGGHYDLLIGAVRRSAARTNADPAEAERRDHCPDSDRGERRRIGRHEALSPHCFP
jgi:hypothetical protein